MNKCALGFYVLWYVYCHRSMSWYCDGKHEYIMYETDCSSCDAFFSKTKPVVERFDTNYETGAFPWEP